MSLGIPAKYEKRTKHGLDKESAKELALKCIEFLPWVKIGFLEDTENYKVLDYKSYGSMLTFGERIRIYIGATEILVISECLFPAQFLDFGKNKSNVTKFYHLFDQQKLKS